MEPLFRIAYDVSIEETKKAFQSFIKKFRRRRQIIFTIVYTVSLVLGVDILIKNTNRIYGLLIIALSLGMLVSEWMKPRTALKHLVTALEQAPEERYNASFFEDRIEIETIQEAASETQAEEPEDTEPRPETTVIRLDVDTVDFQQTEIGFILYLNRRYIYVFPKRCLLETQTEQIETYIREKAL